MTPTFFDEPEELIGYKLDAIYELLSVLGGGATAVVFSGRHLILDRPVAVKMLHPTLALLPEMRARFLREASAAASVDHPNLVRVADARVSAEGYHYLVMEHLSGRDLGRWVTARAPLEMAELVAIATQLAEVLGALHDMGLVHRDLKPENVIVLDEEMGPPRIKLIDLGIVAQAGGGDAAARLTRGDVTLGTVFYMSPEQAAGASVDGRSDLYALGCVLWELAVGRPWVGEGSPSEVLARHLSGQPEPPSRFRADLPAWFDALVLRCLAKKPAQRFQSASEVVAALRQRTAVRPERSKRSGWGWMLAAISVSVVLGFGLGRLGVTTQEPGIGDGFAVHEAPLAERPVVETPRESPARAPEAVAESVPPVEVPAAEPVEAAQLDGAAEVSPETNPANASVAVEGGQTGQVPAARTASPGGAPARSERGPRSQAQPVSASVEKRAVVEGRRRAKLRFAVEPEGSEVRRNGALLGKTPLDVEVEASEAAVAYEVSHASRVTLKLVYPNEVDRVITRSLPRLEGMSAAVSVAPSRGAVEEVAPKAEVRPNDEELWRPSRPGIGETP